jgi:hypothetical protein
MSRGIGGSKYERKPIAWHSHRLCPAHLCPCIFPASFYCLDCRKEQKEARGEAMQGRYLDGLGSAELLERRA